MEELKRELIEFLRERGAKVKEDPYYYYSHESPCFFIESQDGDFFDLDEIMDEVNAPKETE